VPDSVSVFYPRISPPDLPQSEILPSRSSPSEDMEALHPFRAR
ncbi:hypothetical protein MTO96_050333, partial [Rhipicephalus appendiculatus]